MLLMVEIKERPDSSRQLSQVALFVCSRKGRAQFIDGMLKVWPNLQ
jgi:hypothetical protein